MRPTFLLTALSCAVLACQPAPAKLSDADIAAIRASADSFAANALARRDSANAALFAPNGVFMPPNQPAVEGRAAIQAWFGAFPAMSEFTLQLVEIDGRGDVAYVRGTYALTIAAAGRTPAMSDHGKYLEIRRRQADGRWLTALDMFNSDVPLPSR
jgi:uncharacterized protein (TIGR02246 family)